jgi:hypothetical protein
MEANGKIGRCPLARVDSQTPDPENLMVPSMSYVCLRHWSSVAGDFCSITTGWFVVWWFGVDKLMVFFCLAITLA